MTTERFSKEQFEQALTDILSAKGNHLEIIHLGLVSGEYEYRIPLPPNQAISLAIRSSVTGSGYATESGADSIRVWLVDVRNDEPIGSKVQRWVTRVPGWQERLAKVMRELTQRRLSTGDCVKCGAPISIYRVKKNSPNKGRLFGKCTDCGTWWGWLDESKKTYFRKADTAKEIIAKALNSKVENITIKPYPPDDKHVWLDRGYPTWECKNCGLRHDGHQNGLPVHGCTGRKGEYDNGETDTAKDSTEIPKKQSVSPSSHAKAAKGRDLSTNGLSKKRHGAGNQEDKGIESEHHLRGMSGRNESGGLDFLAEDGLVTTTLVLEEETEPIQEQVAYDFPPTPEQLAAIEAPLDKPVRVLAGPGSGKTLLLTHRYKHLVEHGVEPQNILAVTFTKEMANALGSRILAMCPEAERGIEQICTIHAICYRMLRAEGDRRSIPKRWEIKKILEEAIDYHWPLSLERPGYKDVLKYINSAKAQGLQAGEDESFYSLLAGSKLGRLIAVIREKFDYDMYGKNYLTFADMLLDVEVKLKEDDAFRQRWQSKFQFAVIDEGQDCSGQAMRILTALAQPQNRFFIAGDNSQLLFRFAGATPEANLFDGFEERYPDGLLFKLTVNWRSTRTIVDRELALIRHNYESLGGPYEDKYVKELQPRPDAPDGEPISFIWYETPEEEALGVASGILEDMNNGYKPQDFFIASRTRAQTAYIEGALVRAGVQYINLCGGSFWTLKHVQDVVTYLRLAYRESDDTAFQRVFNIASSNMLYPWGEKKGYYCPHRYLGRAFLDACDGSYSNVHRAVRQRSSFEPGVQDLVWFVNDLKAIMATETVADIIGFILEQCYLSHLKAEEGVNIQDEAEDGKLADLNTIKDIARGFESDVKAFLDYVNEMIEAAERAKAKDWSQHVVISTVHRLKGLERNVVYGIGWCEGRDHLGLPAGLLPHTFSLRPPPQNGILPGGRQSRIEDERCIAFVCISRAKGLVRLSGFRTQMNKIFEPSRFVKEVLSDEFSIERKH